MIDHESPAETDEEIFTEAAARLKLAAEAESENRVEGIIALAFEDGEQWDADIGNARKIDGRPALTINHTSTVCSRQINTLRQQRPRIKCHPVGNGADVDTASVVNGLIRHIETLSNASVAYDTGVTSAVKIGWGYWRILSDYIDESSFDQELQIRPIRNTFTVYIDPNAQMPAGEDQMWCLISEKMKRAEYKRRYPKAENSDWQTDAPGDMTLDWESKEEIRLAEYFRIHEIKDTLCLMSDGSTQLKSKMPTPELLQAVNLSQALDPAGKPIERYTTRREVQWFRLNGRKVVERKVMRGKYIPVIRCEGNVLDINGRVRRKGMVKNLMDPARMANYWRLLSTDTPVPTPAGWSTIGQLRVGDRVFDESGKPANIIGKSNVKIRERCYRITFGDGSQVVAGWDHPWPVEERGKRTSKGDTWTNQRVLTQDLTSKKHFIPVAKPLDTETAGLAVHPYLLGLWLGDGSTDSANITPGDDDLHEVRDILTSLGHELGPIKKYGQAAAQFTVLGVVGKLRQIGVLGQKHVPKSYLRASEEQRWALLRGFMDSDGSIGKNNKQCSYTTTNPFIAEGFRELVKSLGIRVATLKREGRRSKLVGEDSILLPFWQFSFSCYADEPVFGLKRKIALQGPAKEQRRRTKRHSIESVEEVASVPLQCIGIDAPSHIFLCGESMIPTYNTAETERYALAPKAPWIAYEGVIEGHPEWHSANQKSYSVLVGKAVDAGGGQILPLPQRTPPAPVEAGMAQAAAGAYQDFMSVSGMAQESPEIAARVVSGNKYLQRRQGMQDLTHFQYYDNQTLAIMWTGIILLDLIPYYYDTQRMQRIIGDDGLPQLVTINEKQPSDTDPAVEEVKNNLQVGKYDVVMDTGPGYQTKREEAAAMLLELMGTPLGLKIVETRPDLAVRNMDFDGAQELADALVATTPEGTKQVMEGLPKQAQTIVATLQQQMQQMQEVIKQQALEIKYKGTIEAARIEKDRENNNRDNSVRKFGIETQAHTARDVAEIRAAAQLLNSKAESDEEEGDSQKLINKGLDS